MTIREPKPPNSVLSLKPPLSPHANHTTSSPLSPISPSTTASTSFHSSSSTYLDLGGECIRDPDWPPPVSRDSICRVYDSSSDDDTELELANAAALHPVLRNHVLHVLESGDGGVYDHWAVEADDALSLEELQLCAEGIETDIDRERRRRPRYIDHEFVASDQGDVPIPPSFAADDDLADIIIGEEDVEPDSGVAHVETLDDADLFTEIPSHGKRGHRRIETLEDIDVLDGIPPLSNGKRGHRRIETLEDIDVPTAIPPLPPSKRGHDRLAIPSDSMTSRQPLGHNRIETLEDVDLYDSPPALKRIEILPDEPLDTPVLNGVQKMRFDDITTIPIPPALPSPTDLDDTPRASYNSDIETTDNTARMDTLSDASTPATSPFPLSYNHAHTEKMRCSKLSELSKRVTIVTRSLASVQMLTASQAASAQVTLPNTTNTTRAEISHLRTTVDHLARLTLAHAHATLDAVTCHTHTHCQSQ